MTRSIPRRALVVSCQARADNPQHGADFMAAMAMAAEQGGAAGIRANGAADIAAIRRVTALPIIGLVKRWRDGESVYITPDEAAAREAAGADYLATTLSGYTEDPPAPSPPPVPAETGHDRPWARLRREREPLAAAEWRGAGAASPHPAIFETFDRTLASPDTRLISIDPAAAAARLVLETRR